MSEELDYDFLKKQRKQLFQKLHDNPELSGKEEETSKIIRDFLEKNTDLTIIQKNGCVIAYQRPKENMGFVALRADMDAIKKSDQTLFHGCGHDGHSTILASLAVAFNKAKDFPANMLYIFQPAEETGEGSKAVLEVLKELELPIEKIYGFHNLPGFKLGRPVIKDECFACASCGMEIELKGRQAHAANPEHGINPGWFLGELLQVIPGKVEQIKKVNQSNILMATLVGLQVGKMDYGISPGEGRAGFTLRGESIEDLTVLRNELEGFCFREAEKKGLKISITYHDEFPDTVNTNSLVEKLCEVLTISGYEYDELEEPMRWSEDFGWYLKNYPGVYFGIGSGENCPELHDDTYHFPKELIDQSIDMLTTIIKKLQ